MVTYPLQLGVPEGLPRRRLDAALPRPFAGFRVNPDPLPPFSGAHCLLRHGAETGVIEDQGSIDDVNPLTLSVLI